MNGLHPIRVAGEGLERWRLVGLKQVRDIVQLGREIGKVQPRQIILQIAPDSLNGVQLWTVGRQPYIVDILQRSLHPSDVEHLIGMVESLETLPDPRQLMGILGHKSVP